MPTHEDQLSHPQDDPRVARPKAANRGSGYGADASRSKRDRLTTRPVWTLANATTTRRRRAPRATGADNGFQSQTWKNSTAENPAKSVKFSRPAEPGPKDTANSEAEPRRSEAQPRWILRGVGSAHANGNLGRVRRAPVRRSSMRRNIASPSGASRRPRTTDSSGDSRNSCVTVRSILILHLRVASKRGHQRTASRIELCSHTGPAPRGRRCRPEREAP
jgi:hypothetical protein